ncbi:hypothetical protein F66182_7081 [Fusarium sp. NRRL 66182]|nr:hypothetical protein F66182_7081 [Fusarium sp. NRRL 66182]
MRTSVALCLVALAPLLADARREQPTTTLTAEASKTALDDWQNSELMTEIAAIELKKRAEDGTASTAASTTTQSSRLCKRKKSSGGSGSKSGSSSRRRKGSTSGSNGDDDCEEEESAGVKLSLRWGILGLSLAGCLASSFM